MKYDSIKRRMFLQGSAGALLSIPFLSSLAPRGARANPGDGPRRFIAIKSYNGQYAQDFFPTLNGAGYQLRSSIIEKGPKTRDHTTHLHDKISGTQFGTAPLSDFVAAEGRISKIIGAGLNPYADQMTLIRGLDFMPATNHNDGGMLGNYAESEDDAAKGLPQWPSIDQVMAWSDKFYESTPALRSLHLGPGGNKIGRKEHNTFSFTDNGIAGGAVSPMDSIIDPRVAFDMLFGDGDTEEPNPENTARQEADRLIVDKVYDDYVRIKESPRLSSGDRQLLERHMAFLAEAQGRLNIVRKACVPPDAPRSQADRYDVNVDNLREVYDAMIDVAVAALICDRTRIVTLDVIKAIVDRDGGNDTGYRQDAARPGSWHGDAHSLDGEPRQRLEALNRWIAEQIFGRFIEHLNVEESDGETYLDRTVIYWGNELADGWRHANFGVPALLAGGSALGLNTGKFFSYHDWENQGCSFFFEAGYPLMRGLPHNRLLVTLLQAMGLSPADYERNGKPGYGEYSINGKNPDNHDLGYDQSQYGAVLPGYF